MQSKKASGKNHLHSETPYMRATPNLPTQHRWKKGESGNPKGNPPKEKQIPFILRKYANMPAAPGAIRFLRKAYPHRDIRDDIPTCDVILMRAEYDAEWGDEKAREFYANRTDGKVRDYLDVTTDDQPIDRPTINISALTTDKLATLREIIRAAVRNKST